jgi:hypothetical protein
MGFSVDQQVLTMDRTLLEDDATIYDNSINSDNIIKLNHISEDSPTLSDCKVHHLSALHLVVRLRGGMFHFSSCREMV